MNFPKKWFTVINNEVEHKQIFDICKEFFPETNLTIASVSVMTDPSYPYSYPFVVANSRTSGNEMGYIGWDTSNYISEYAEKLTQVEFEAVYTFKVKIVDNKIDKMIEELEGKLTAHENKIDKMIEEITAMRNKLKSGMDELDATRDAIRNMKIGS